MQKPSPGLLAYIWAASLVAGAFVIIAVRGDATFDPRAALIFGLLCFLAEQFPVTMPSRASYSVSFVITIAAIVAAGPAEAAIATICGTIDAREVLRSPWYRHLFNAAQLGTTAALAGMTYVTLGGPIGRTQDLFPSILIPLLLGSLVNFLVNTALVSGAVALRDGTRASDVWRSQFRGLGRGYVAFAFLGLLLGVLYLIMDWPSILFLLVPLLIARHAFQAAVNMERAFEATVMSLIGAIEAKDLYTRGHAERVSRLSEMTARAYGLPNGECRVVRLAALMHDIGKLGVRSSILQKPGKLTSDEYEHMKLHPVRGVEIVSGIDVLRDAIVAVRHHHERVDGTGYPDGLIGEEIPLYARLIMVADAFDSMTSTRVYRKAKTIEEAFAELRRASGTQFDGKAIDALVRGVERWGWEPSPEATADATEEITDEHHARVATL